MSCVDGIDDARNGHMIDNRIRRKLENKLDSVCGKSEEKQKQGLRRDVH